jgi:hypothetical protein
LLIVTACIFALSVLTGCSGDECDPCAPVVTVQPLAQLNMSMGGSATALTDTLRITFSSSINDTLFDMLVTNDDDGTVRTIDAGVYPNFDDAAVKLSDGVNDMWTFWARFYPEGGGGGGAGNYESNWIDGGLTGEYDPDLYDAEITKLVIHLDEVVIDHLGSSTIYDLRVRLVIMGRP